MHVVYSDIPNKEITAYATQIVIYNDLGDPISFVIKLDSNKCIASHFGDKDFDTYLNLFHIESKPIDNNYDRV